MGKFGENFGKRSHTSFFQSDNAVTYKVLRDFLDYRKSFQDKACADKPRGSGSFNQKFFDELMVNLREVPKADVFL